MVQLLFVVYKIPKMREISLENHFKILVLHEQGIAMVVECSRCAVQSALKRFAETGITQINQNQAENE